MPGGSLSLCFVSGVSVVCFVFGRFKVDGADCGGGGGIRHGSNAGAGAGVVWVQVLVQVQVVVVSVLRSRVGFFFFTVSSQETEPKITTKRKNEPNQNRTVCPGGGVPGEGGAAVLVLDGQGPLRRDLPEPAGQAPAQSALGVRRYGEADDRYVRSCSCGGGRRVLQ